MEPLRYTAPPDLYQEVRSSLRAAERAGAPRRLPWLLPALAASVALAALVGWWAYRTQAPLSRDDRLAYDIVTNHVRSLILEPHLLDVKSSNRHIIKPSFQGKLNFAPTVVDLADRECPLIGARLGFLDDRRVAAIVYRRRDHLINLYTWPSAPGADRAPRVLERQGYHLVLRGHDLLGRLRPEQPGAAGIRAPDPGPDPGRATAVTGQQGVGRLRRGRGRHRPSRCVTSIQGASARHTAFSGSSTASVHTRPNNHKKRRT